MPSFFDEHKGTFAECQITSGGLDTVAFLNAAEVLVVLLESMGAAFGPVKSDISGNIAVIILIENTKEVCQEPRCLQNSANDGKC